MEVIMSYRDAPIKLEENEEEVLSVFLLEDLLKEYNHKIAYSPISPLKKRVPLSLQPIEENYYAPYIRPTSKISSSTITISPMTEKELFLIPRHHLKGNDWFLLRSIMSKHLEPKGIVSNTPDIAQFPVLINVISELGLKGQVYHKTVGNKTYVILKGSPASRTILKGTRYLNDNPKIVQFGLAKTNVKTLFKSGIKTSVWIYGAIKALEAVEMVVEEGELKTSFFSQLVTDVPKLAITSAVTAAAGGAVVAAGVPVAIGIGIILVVGFVTSVALEYFDQKGGITEKVDEAAEKMVKDLISYMNEPSNNSQRLSSHWDPQHGLIFENPLMRYPQRWQKKNYLDYTEIA